MHRYRGLAGRFPANVLSDYDAASRRLHIPADRFSNRVLTNFNRTQARAPFAIVAADASVAAEILLYDEIGYWGVTAKDFVLALAQVGDGPLTLRINSPGGDVFDGYAIYNALRARTAPVNVVIDGIAASAASFIAMAGASIAMGEAAMLMIHNAQGMCWGDRNAMADMVDVLGKIDGQIAAIYASKAAADASIFATAMDAETWYTSSEAIDMGLADSIIAPATQGPIDPAAKAKALNRSGARARRAEAKTASSPRNAVEPYDPDGDGDNDAQQALDCVNMAMAHLSNAVDCLNGGDDEDENGDESGETNRARLNPRAAATSSEWQCGADQNLPVNTDKDWDGPAAAERMLDAAGFNGASPDPAKAKRGFLAWDHHNPKLKSAYKLPFADLIDGTLTALKSGVDAAASRLPDTDIPDDVKTSARAVLDHYETRMKPTDDDASNRLRTMRNRLRIIEAEEAA